MTLPGGPANKLGNRYEKWWTVSEFVRMLLGSTEAIRIEVPGVEKAEFVVKTGSRRELHQVKRSHPSGKWSLIALRAVGLLQAIGEQLAGNDHRFVFVSGSAAPELSKLCEAANSAESVEEFKRDFLAAKERKRLFGKLMGYWRCDIPTAVKRLRRIDIHTIDERELRDKVRWGVQALFLTDSNSVVEELRGIAEDSVHCTITRQELVEKLDRRGYRRRRLHSPEHAGVAVKEATDRYLDGARNRLIQQRLVRRVAAGSLLSGLDGISTDSVLTGRAGSGKSACVVEVAEALQERGIPVLAFRLDRVVSALTTTDLGNHLDLEESPVLVLAAAAKAAVRPCVLIVDQLDAVSTMPGRSSDAFDLVERLLHEARGTRARATIHTVVVCRTFDWKNDSRLRQLMPDSRSQVEVTEFTVDEVKTILEDGGFDLALFQASQLELLRLPQNLSLFLESGLDVSGAPAVDTATKLFDQYWDKKRQSVAEQVARDQWMEVMETLCREMTSTQELSVPKERLDTIQPDYLRSLASEGVLTFDGRRYGFGHESFFDYCFARLFINQSKSLVSFLKRSEQHLFRRAQVRQVLTYLRDADFPRYVDEVRGLLSDERIRAHIKHLVFALLAEVADPTEQEWAIWEQWTATALKAIEQGTSNSDKLSALACRRFFGSSSWFAFAECRNMIKHWLASGNDRLADKAVNYLKLHQRHSPDHVAALLEPHADCGGEWAPRLKALMKWADYHTSRSFFDLFLRLVDNGTLDEAQGAVATNDTFWSMLHGLGENCPEWIPEVLAHRLRKRLADIRTAGEDLRHAKLLGSDDHFATAMFATSAKRAPSVFVENVLPVVLEISDAALIADYEPPKRDAVWRSLIKTKHPDGKDACLSTLAAALAALAHEGDADLCDVIADLRRRDTYVANYLLLALYRGGAACYADDAVLLLCDEQWRFQCGFSDSPNWCAMELIRAVFPLCTVENRKRLETAILFYSPPFERTSLGYKKYGRSRFALLSAIPTELRSTSANARFEELARKFGEPVGEACGITAAFFGSPIKKAAADKMTDADWLRAIAKYRTEYPTNFSPGDLKGGARELANVLEARVKEEPERFARLSLRFPEDTNPVYFESTLDALKSATISSDLKLQVCRKAFTGSRGPFGKSIADVLGGMEDRLPDGAVRMLHWLATEHDDPADEAWKQDAGGGTTYDNGDIHENGINTTRGRAVGAIHNLILHNAAYIERFRPTLDRMIRDRSASVLSCVAGVLRVVAYYDPALGMLLFRSMNLSEDRLLATDHVYEFIRGGLCESFAELRLLVVRMLRSSEPEVREAGARLASIAALVLEDGSATELVDEALRGEAHTRLGVAQVASASIADPEYRAWSEAKLSIFFNDDDADVRREAGLCFRRLGDESLDRYEDLVTSFCNSRAYEEGSLWIIHALENSLGRLPGMTCLVCERFLDRSESTGIVAKLTFRMYQQHQKDQWTSRSLDLIDRLCLEGIADAEEEFEQFER